MYAVLTIFFDKLEMQNSEARKFLKPGTNSEICAA